MGEHILGKFCSVAKKDTIIMPKNIPGYKTPEGQVLKEENQKFHFIYTPIKYNITYVLHGGETTSEYKTLYTIEDNDYIPPAPIKKKHTFIGWTPEKIAKGSIGDITMSANWKPNAILFDGPKLNEALSKLAGNKNNIIAIHKVDSISDRLYVNISSTSTPVLAAFDDGVIYIYSRDPIYCNNNMKSAFAGFTLLRDITCLSDWICEEGTDISNIFDGCSLLSDVSPISEWANGVFSDFTDAFKDTQALIAKRVPLWYRWNIQINYKSTTGKVLKSINDKVIPGETIYLSQFNGYEKNNTEFKVTSPDMVVDFEYSPIEYTIRYNLDGGEITNQKESYTIEDESYYPPEPIKAKYTFEYWIPDHIASGDTGNVIFNAKYKPL